MTTRNYISLAFAASFAFLASQALGQSDASEKKVTSTAGTGNADVEAVTNALEAEAIAKANSTESDVKTADIVPACRTYDRKETTVHVALPFDASAGDKTDADINKVFGPYELSRRVVTGFLTSGLIHMDTARVNYYRDKPKYDDTRMSGATDTVGTRFIARIVDGTEIDTETFEKSKGGRPVTEADKAIFKRVMAGLTQCLADHPDWAQGFGPGKTLQLSSGPDASNATKSTSEHSGTPAAPAQPDAASKGSSCSFVSKFFGCHN